MLACNKARELYQLKQTKKNTPENEPAYFFVNADYSQLKVMYNDITWIEGVKDYIKIHLKPPAKPLMVRMSMKAIEEELPASRFLRIHKSYIVSVDGITSVRKNSVFIGQMELPVG